MLNHHAHYYNHKSYSERLNATKEYERQLESSSTLWALAVAVLILGLAVLVC